MLPPPAIHSYESVTGSYQTLHSSLGPANKLWPSFVLIEFRLPYLVNGMVRKQVSFCVYFIHMYIYILFEIYII